MTETVVEGVSGVFFSEQTVESIVDAVKHFRTLTFDSERIAKSARRFGAENFRSAIRNHLDALMEARRRGPLEARRQPPVPLDEFGLAESVYG